MKFYCEQITIMLDDTSAHSLTEYPTENDALSAFHSAMASAVINPSVKSIHAEAKNSAGGIYQQTTWVAREE